jgi:chromosome segregation ATPase
MKNISDEIKIIDAEIEKMEKAILREVEDYKALSREVSGHFTRYNNIPPKVKIFKEAKKILVDAMLNGNKDLEAHKHTIKALQSRLDTLKQSKENKLNKIVFREDLEEVDKLQKEAEELKQRKAELSAKYAKPEKTPQTKLPRGRKLPYVDQAKFNSFLEKINVRYKTASLKQKARGAISQMKSEKLFLKEDGNPIYTAKSIVNKLSLISNLKKDGKKTKK